MPPRPPKSIAGRADPEAAVRAAAVALLARRDYGSGALCEKLCSRGFERAAAEALIAELTREGVLDDARFAENYVAYHVGRGQGPLRIAAALRKLGLEEALADRALSSGWDWSALARKVQRTKFGRPPSDWTQRARQARFLQYRGFSADHIRAVTGTDSEVD